MSFGAGLGKFKKVHQDHMQTILEDDHGKRITVVHSALPQGLRQQLEGMPTAFKDGGGAVGASQNDVEDPKPVEVNVNTAPPQQAPASVFGNQPVNAQVAPAPRSPDLLTSDQTLNAPKAVTQEQQAVREQQAIDSAKGAQQANIEQGYNTQRSAIAQQEQNQINEVKKHADEFANYMQKNPINANHYQENISTGRRVTNAIGLILGGFGQGLVGGSNPAQDYISKQIDRDIDMQKANVDNHKSIYSGYLDLYKDQQAAQSAAKASMLDLYTHKANQVAAQLATPQAKAAADAFAAKNAIERNQLLIDTAGRLGTLNTGTVLGSVSPSQSGNGGSGAPSPTMEPPLSEAGDQTLFSKAANLVGAGRSESLADEPEKVNYYDTHVLFPGAPTELKKLPYKLHAQNADDQKPEVLAQYHRAALVEKALGTVNDTFRNMAHESAMSGIAGELKRRGGSDALHGVPLVGSTLGRGFDYLSDTESSRRYDSYKQQLVADMKAAFKGTDTSPAEVEKAVDANSPERGDSPETIQLKRNMIRRTLINSLKTDLLEQYGLAPKRSK